MANLVILDRKPPPEDVSATPMEHSSDKVTHVSERSVLGLRLGTIVMVVVFVFGMGATWTKLLTTQTALDNTQRAKSEADAENFRRMEASIGKVSESVNLSLVTHTAQQAEIARRDRQMQDQIAQQHTERIIALESRIPALYAAEAINAQIRSQQGDLTRRVERVEMAVDQIPQMFTLLRVMEERSSNQANAIKEQGELMRKILERVSPNQPIKP